MDDEEKKGKLAICLVNEVIAMMNRSVTKRVHVKLSTIEEG